jgi:ribosomal protein S1
MKERGKIIEFTPEKGGYGVILTNKNLKINFEKCECNYDKIRIGDEVDFHIYKSLNNNLDALNIEFFENKLLSDLNIKFQKQIKIECIVIKIKPKGFLLDYQGLEIYLPLLNSNEENLLIGDHIEIYIKHFSNFDFIIASQTEIDLNKHKKYNRFFEKNETLEFEIENFNSGGILVSDGYSLGFIPDSHIVPLNKNELEIGQKLFVKILSYSISTGLKLSVRNHYFNETINTLKNAFDEQYVLKGTIKNISNFYHTILFEGFGLKMNKEFLTKEIIIEGEEIEFRIIDFNSRNDVSVSNIEVSSFGLIENFRNKNQFYGVIKEILSEGLIIELNKGYKSGYLPKNEISDVFPWNFDLERIKIGSRIKVSISKFNYRGIYLSRILYKKIQRRSIASVRNSIGDKFKLKILDRMAKFGVLVADESVKGIIPLENILPLNIINVIDKLDFIKHCNFVFKRRSIIECVIMDIDVDLNKIYFDLDYSMQENKTRVHSVLTYFENDIDEYNCVNEFYMAKIFGN